MEYGKIAKSMHELLVGKSICWSVTCLLRPALGSFCETIPQCFAAGPRAHAFLWTESSISHELILRWFKNIFNVYMVTESYIQSGQQSWHHDNCHFANNCREYSIILCECSILFCDYILSCDTSIMCSTQLPKYAFMDGVTPNTYITFKYISL